MALSLQADDAPFAVPLERYEHPALRVLVNFGIVTGRDPTQQEIQQRLVREGATWVGRCIANVGDTSSLAELRARRAVVDGRDVGRPYA